MSDREGGDSDAFEQIERVLAFLREKGMVETEAALRAELEAKQITPPSSDSPGIRHRQDAPPVSIEAPSAGVKAFCKASSAKSPNSKAGGESGQSGQDRRGGASASNATKPSHVRQSPSISAEEKALGEFDALILSPRSSTSKLDGFNDMSSEESEALAERIRAQHKFLDSYASDIASFVTQFCEAAVVRMEQADAQVRARKCCRARRDDVPSDAELEDREEEPYSEEDLTPSEDGTNPQRAGSPSPRRLAPEEMMTLAEAAASSMIRDTWVPGDEGFDRIDPQAYFEAHDREVPQLPIQEWLGQSDSQLQHCLQKICLQIPQLEEMQATDLEDGATLAQQLSGADAPVKIEQDTSILYATKLFCAETTPVSGTAFDQTMKVELLASEFAVSLDLPTRVHVATVLQQQLREKDVPTSRAQLPHVAPALSLSRQTSEGGLADNSEDGSRDHSASNEGSESEGNPTMSHFTVNAHNSDSSDSDGVVLLDEAAKRRIQSRVRARYAAAHGIHSSQFVKNKNNAWGDECNDASDELESTHEVDSDEDADVARYSDIHGIDNELDRLQRRSAKQQQQQRDPEPVEDAQLPKLLSDDGEEDAPDDEALVNDPQANPESSNGKVWQELSRSHQEALSQHEDIARVSGDASSTTEEKQVSNTHGIRLPAAFLTSTYEVLRRSIDSILGRRADADSNPPQHLQENPHSHQQHPPLTPSQTSPGQPQDADRTMRPPPLQLAQPPVVESKDQNHHGGYALTASAEYARKSASHIRVLVPVPLWSHRSTAVHYYVEERIPRSRRVRLISPDDSDVQDLSLAESYDSEGQSHEDDLSFLSSPHLRVIPDPRSSHVWWRIDYHHIQRPLAREQAKATLEALRVFLATKPQFLAQTSIISYLNATLLKYVPTECSLTVDYLHRLLHSNLDELVDTKVGFALAEAIPLLKIEIPTAFALPIVSPIPLQSGLQPTADFPAEPDTIVAQRFRIIAQAGAAAFCKTYIAEEINTRYKVCLKIMNNTKNNLDQALDEVRITTLLNEADPNDEFHVSRLYTYFYYKEHLIMCFRLGLMDLYAVSQIVFNDGSVQEIAPNITRLITGNHFFSIRKIREIARQLLISLWFLRCFGVTHNDMKPENVLVDQFDPIRVRLIDFGSSCYSHNVPPEYAQSRTYRAPEVILGLPYTSFPSAPDMWSLGCILYECFTGEPLFTTRSLPIVLARMQAICGPFPEDMLRQGRMSQNYFRLVAQVPLNPEAHLLNDEDDTVCLAPLVSGGVMHKLTVPVTTPEGATTEATLKARTWYEVFQRRDTKLYPTWEDLDKIGGMDAQKFENLDHIEESLLRPRPTSILARLLSHARLQQDLRCQEQLRVLREEHEAKMAEIYAAYNDIKKEREAALRAVEANEELQAYGIDPENPDFNDGFLDGDEDEDEECSEDDEGEADADGDSKRNSRDLNSLWEKLQSLPLDERASKFRGRLVKLNRQRLHYGTPLTRKDLDLLDDHWKSELHQLEIEEMKATAKYSDQVMKAQTSTLSGAMKLGPDGENALGPLYSALLACHPTEWPGVKPPPRPFEDDRVEHILQFKQIRTKQQSPANASTDLADLWNPYNPRARFFGPHHPAKLAPHESLGLFANFLNQLLRLRPEERPTPEQALMHPFLWQLDDDEDWNL